MLMSNSDHPRLHILGNGWTCGVVCFVAGGKNIFVLNDSYYLVVRAALSRTAEIFIVHNDSYRYFTIIVHQTPLVNFQLRRGLSQETLGVKDYNDSPAFDILECLMQACFFRVLKCGSRLTCFE